MRPILASLITTSILLTGAARAAAQDLPPTAAQPLTTAELIANAPAEAWRTPDPANLLYLSLPAGTVVIELAPQFAPAHVANVRRLAKAGFWDGTSVYRVQDNFVAQWGDVFGDEPDKAKPLGDAGKPLPAEFQVPLASVNFASLPDTDGWSSGGGFVDGFPAARDHTTGTTWMAHCYGMVGAGRNNAPDSSLGAELYAVIGQAPRNLDRNMSPVGRIIRGIEHFSALPRGPEPMGFYADRSQDLPILQVRLGSDMPADERLPLQVMRTDSPHFAAVVESRRNRQDAFYQRPAGHIDLCNIVVPVREAP